MTDPVWLPLADVAVRFTVSKDTVRARMAETPDHIERPWVNHGSAGRRAVYSFEVAKVDAWWREVNEWRASVRGEESSRSDGGTPTGGSGPGSATPSAPRKSSTRARLPPKSKGNGSSLMRLLRPMTSRPA